MKLQVLELPMTLDDPPKVSFALVVSEATQEEQSDWSEGGNKCRKQIGAKAIIVIGGSVEIQPPFENSYAHRRNAGAA